MGLTWQFAPRLHTVIFSILIIIVPQKRRLKTGSESLMKNVLSRPIYIILRKKSIPLIAGIYFFVWNHFQGCGQKARTALRGVMLHELFTIPLRKMDEGYLIGILYMRSIKKPLWATYFPGIIFGVLIMKK